MRLLRGRVRRSDLLIVVIALVAATAATALITRADQQMAHAAGAERLLEGIEENESELYDLSVELLSGDAQADDVRNEDARGARQVARIQSRGDEPRKAEASGAAAFVEKNFDQLLETIDVLLTD